MKPESKSSWYVYMLRCNDNSLYTGTSNNVEKRVKMHNAGRGAKYTKMHLPVQLVYLEVCVDRSQACRREADIKQLSKAKKEALLVAFGKIS